MEKKQRLIFELIPSMFKSFEDTRLKAELPTKLEVFNNAMTLFRWALKASFAGKRIAAIDEENGTYETYDMPVLEHARSQGDDHTRRLASEFKPKRLASDHG
jgi:hypothetical protein